MRKDNISLKEDQMKQIQNVPLNKHEIKPIYNILFNEYTNIKHGFFRGIDSKGHSLSVGLNIGNDDVAINNRQRIADYFGVAISNLIILNQKHSNIVHVINDNNIDKYKFSSIKNALNNEGDAIITNIPNLLIGVNTADCAPILLFDEQKHYIAVIHSGWRGTISSIIENTITELKELGCDSIIASVGPCISKNNLELEKELIPYMYRKKFTTNIDNIKCNLDMVGLINYKLQNSKVIKNISSVNIDTFSNKAFYSYRRAHQKREGLQFSGIMLVNN
ncbi:MAG: polyphenol oxidase family protein [Alphaproteobacteria bacterium]|nr:polyphenol oxidase family protein [Alphaproteobacteria bacterium]